MTPQELASKCVRTMLERDLFSAWLGIELLEVRPGFAAVKMMVRREMINGFGVAHGGIVYSLADTAFAFAANTYDRVSMSIQNSISYPAPTKPGDQLVATCEEESVTKSLGFYNVTVVNQEKVKVGMFRGTLYRTQRKLLEESL